MPIHFQCATSFPVIQLHQPIRASWVTEAQGSVREGSTSLGKSYGSDCVGSSQAAWILRVLLKHQWAERGLSAQR